MKENDILYLRNIINNIKKEVDDGKIVYSHYYKSFIINDSEFQLSLLQQWISQHIKNSNDIEKVNRCIGDIVIKKKETTYTKYLVVYLIENSKEYSLLEIFI